MAVVDDVTRRRATVAQAQVAGHELREIGLQRRRDQAADIHLGPRREQHAARVLQVDMAIGAQAAENRARLVAEHTVQGHRTGRRLNEAHRRFGPDRKAGPVGDHAGRGLVDGHGLAVDLDRARTAHHDAAAGQDLSRHARRHQQTEREDRAARRRATALSHAGLARRARALRNCDHHAAATIEDKAVRMGVHGSPLTRDIDDQNCWLS